MSNAEQQSKQSHFLTHLLALGLLAVAHLPFAVVEFSRLWWREHYQFFPFAFGAFAWLLYSRRRPGAFQWDHFNSLLVAGDLVCLSAGVALPSPWLVCFGLLLVLLVVCRSFFDVGYQSSLAYLILLPLITLRLPGNYDLDLIQWLQRVTTSVASELLNFVGVLHLRLGNVLEFPGKRFLVEEACSGVQSLFTLLFLAVLIICGYRRRLLHAIVVLATALCVAGVMNTLRVCTVAVAWSRFGSDLSSGWQHDTVGYIALVVGALLVLSADAFAEFFTGFVPDEPGAGVQAVFRNPFIVLWNRIFFRVPLDPEAPAAPVVGPALRTGTIALGGASLVCLVFITLQFIVYEF